MGITYSKEKSSSDRLASDGNLRRSADTARTLTSLPDRQGVVLRLSLSAALALHFFKRVQCLFMFRHKGTEDLAIDVTGATLPLVSPSTNWVFLDPIDTPRFPPPWEFADFQCLLRRLSEDGFSPGSRRSGLKEFTLWMGASDLNEVTQEFGSVGAPALGARPATSVLAEPLVGRPIRLASFIPSRMREQ